MASMWGRVAIGSAAVWLTVAPVRAAEDLSALAGEAEQAVSAGNTLQALDLAERIRQAVWDEAPLAFRKAVLVDSEPTEFGKEVARADNVFNVDEEIHIYAEPVAFGWQKVGDGFETDMVADVRVATTDGKIIAGHKGFSQFKIDSAEPNPDTFLTVTYVFGGLGAGDYIVTTTLSDKITGKSGVFSTPIKIR
jgi:hypothetical protein